MLTQNVPQSSAPITSILLAPLRARPPDVASEIQAEYVKEPAVEMADGVTVDVATEGLAEVVEELTETEPLAELDELLETPDELEDAATEGLVEELEKLLETEPLAELDELLEAPDELEDAAAEELSLTVVVIKSVSVLTSVVVTKEVTVAVIAEVTVMNIVASDAIVEN